MNGVLIKNWYKKLSYCLEGVLLHFKTEISKQQREETPKDTDMDVKARQMGWNRWAVN